MKRAIILSALALTGLWAEAQSLSLDQCRQKALEHNKTLESAKIKLEQTRFDSQSYRANFFPKINLMAADLYSTAHGSLGIDGFQLPIKKLDPATGTYNYDVTVLPDGNYVYNSYTDVPPISEQWKVKNIFSGGISILEPVYSGGKVSTAYRMSKTGVGMAQENIRLTESEVLVNTDEAYILAVKAKELGEVAKSYQSLLAEVRKNVEGAVAHGMATRNDLMKVQVKQNEAELSIRKAENGYRLALMNLCRMIGMPLDSKIDVEKLAVDDAETFKPSAADISSRPEYSILQSKTDLARDNVKITRSDLLPTVAVGASYSYINGLEFAGKKLVDGGSAAVGIAVTVPIDVFGGTTSKVRSAKAAHQIALLEQQELNEKMQLEVAQCANNVDEAVIEMNICRQSVAQAEENVKMSQRQYQVGLEPLSDYLESQALWQNASADLVQARCLYLLSKTKYMKAIGALK